MINCIVLFETFTVESMQVSRLRKNWIVCIQPIKFEKISDQPIRAKQASAYARWRDMTIIIIIIIIIGSLRQDKGLLHDGRHGSG